MSKLSKEVRGLYFEEFSVGEVFSSSGRTITESDIVNFAGLSGDYNQIHTDAQFSKDTPFGRRVAHGLLVLSVATGLIDRTGMLDGTVIAFREINSWKFVKPVFIGDTVHVDVEVVETKAIPRVGGGAVEIKLSVINQNNVVVMRGIWTALMVGKPED
jgi:acyl dehydratase